MLHMKLFSTINRHQISEDTAKLLLRLVLGVTVLIHGLYKLMNPESLGFIGGLFEAWYLPAFLAYLVYLGEVIAPIMLILGYQTKTASLLIAITLAVAVILVHLPQLFTISQTGGWSLELQALMFFSAVALFGLGAGKYSIDAKNEAETVTIPV